MTFIDQMEQQPKEWITYLRLRAVDYYKQNARPANIIIVHPDDIDFLRSLLFDLIIQKREIIGFHNLDSIMGLKIMMSSFGMSPGYALIGRDDNIIHKVWRDATGDVHEIKASRFIEIKIIKFPKDCRDK